MSKGNFFAVGAKEFAQACELGIRPAVALLVMARGTLKDNATTSWSAQSVFNYTGMAWRRAQSAIELLIEEGLVEQLKEGKKPRYKLKKPQEVEDFIWLPNELVDGAGNETPPIRRLRERGELGLLQKFIELYSIHDLTADGGLPRAMVRTSFERTKIGLHGPFAMYGFQKKETTANAIEPLTEFNGAVDEDNNRGAWVILKPLLNMGLIECVNYMVESDDYESEFLYQINDETTEAMDFFTGMLDVSGGEGFARQIYKFYPLVGLAIQDLKHATLVGVFRLRYRPKTAKTTVWHATERGQTEAFVAGIKKLCGIEEKDVDINDLQSSSKLYQ